MTRTKSDFWAFVQYHGNGDVQYRLREWHAHADELGVRITEVSTEVFTDHKFGKTYEITRIRLSDPVERPLNSWKGGREA